MDERYFSTVIHMESERTSFDDYFVYSEKEIIKVTKEGILLSDGKIISFNECSENFDLVHRTKLGVCVGERFVNQNRFVFYTSDKPTIIEFIKRRFLSSKSVLRKFNNLYNLIISFGYKTYDIL